MRAVSWGTKSLDKANTDLGIIVVGEKNSVDIVLPTAQADIGESESFRIASLLGNSALADLAYDDSLHNLRTRPKIIPALKSASQREQDKQDFYKNTRVRYLSAQSGGQLVILEAQTNVVLLWILTNVLPNLATMRQR